ncbi:MAG: hypothetical protein SGPRY_012226, partial [Prymnesium sp.]
HAFFMPAIPTLGPHALPPLVISRLPLPSASKKRVAVSPRPEVGMLHHQVALNEQKQLVKQMSWLKRENEELSERNHVLAKRLNVSEGKVRSLAEKNDILHQKLQDSESAVQKLQREAVQSARDRELAHWRELAERDRLVHEATRRTVVAEAETKATAERAVQAESTAKRLQDQVSEAQRDAHQAEESLRQVCAQRTEIFKTQISEVVEQIATVAAIQRPPAPSRDALTDPSAQDSKLPETRSCAFAGAIDLKNSNDGRQGETSDLTRVHPGGGMKRDRYLVSQSRANMT